MKKTAKIFILAGTIIFAGIILFSCHKEQTMTTGVMEQGTMVLKGGIADEFDWTDPVCAGNEHEYCLHFPQAYKPNGAPKQTQVQVQLELAGDDPNTTEVETSYFIPVFGGAFNQGPQCFYYSLDAGEYLMRYKIGGGGYKSVTINVYALPTATLTSEDISICQGESADLSIDLTGIAPWNISYSANGTTGTIAGINANPYVLSVVPENITTYVLTEVSDANCENSATGSVTVTPTACCTWSPNKIACGEGTEFLNHPVDNWFTYFSYEEGPVTLLTENGMMVGSAIFSPVIDRNVTITIVLIDNVRLTEGETEAVKIQGGDTPMEWLDPGSYSTYKGISTTITVPEYVYYAIHLSFQICE